MILQALAEYYELRRLESRETPPPGFQLKPIEYVITLTSSGDVLEIEPTREMRGDKWFPKLQIVPAAVDRTGKNSWQTAFLLWDHPRYVLGITKDDEDPEMGEKRFASFVSRLREAFPNPACDDGVLAVSRFLEKKDFSKIHAHSEWESIRTTNTNITFRLVRDRCQLICQRPKVVEQVQKDFQTTGGLTGHCLITGKKAPISRLHTATPILGSQSTAKFISYDKPAFSSFGKEQSFNAPTSRYGEFAYTTAFNELMRGSSEQCVHFGGTSLLFWSDQRSDLEQNLPQLMGFDVTRSATPADIDESADTTTRKLLSHYASLYKSEAFIRNESTHRFFVLGVSAPSNSRIAIRFWINSTVQEITQNIEQHFKRIEISHHPDARAYPSIPALLRSIAPVANKLSERDKKVDNLLAQIIDSVLSNTPYPRSLLTTAVRRNAAERNVVYLRAAIIKGCLNSAAVNNEKTCSKEELSVSLDKRDTTPTSYRLGRLFAVLEQTQLEANPDIKKTIRDTYWAAAAGSPARVFPTLLNLNIKHLGKIRRDKPGRAVNISKLIEQISKSLDPNVPFQASHSIEDQGRFAVGYWHQKQDPSTYKAQGENT